MIDEREIAMINRAIACGFLLLVFGAKGHLIALNMDTQFFAYRTATRALPGYMRCYS